MSVLEIYISWVNSVLAETGGRVDGVEAVQEGRVLCELIDILAPTACLVSKVKCSGDCTPLAYINAALEHMQKHGVRIKFPAQDIINNEIKSMLDVLWILILNYGIHNIGQNAFQRSVGTGKKHLLEWCREQLGASFDPGRSLTENLCKDDRFIQLLERVAGNNRHRRDDKTEYIDSLLSEIQDRYKIVKDIIKACDIVDGIVDEHTLMIYLSLLKRRYSNKDLVSSTVSYRTAADARSKFAEKHDRPVTSESRGSRSDEGGSGPTPHRGRNLYSHVAADDNETSEWSSTGSLNSYRPTSHQSSSLQVDSMEDDTLYETIRERVIEHIPPSETDRRRPSSEKETDTRSERAHGPVNREGMSSKPRLSPTQLHSSDRGSRSSTPDPHRSSTPDPLSHEEPSASWTSKTRTGPPHGRHGSRDHADGRGKKDDATTIRIRRPKDHILQWEETMDRLSSVSVLDPAGSPLTPLISGYTSSFPTRSRSVDEGKLRHRYSSPTTQGLGPSSRSKSASELPKIRMHVTSPGRITLRELESALQKLPADLRDDAKVASDFFLQHPGAGVSALIDVIKNIKVDPRLAPQVDRSYSPSSYDLDETSVKRPSSAEPRQVGRHRSTSENRQSPSVSARTQSLSPQRRSVLSSGLAADGERGSDTMLSVAPRSISPDQWTERKEIDFRGVRDVTLSNIDYTDRPVHDTEWRHHRELSPPRGGGVGRVPRREAWEVQRKVRENSVDSSLQPGYNQLQPGYIQLLGQEIQDLKLKLELMEKDEASRSSWSRSGRSHRDSVTGGGHSLSLYPPQLSRERASSCPLLKVSGTSPLLRSPRVSTPSTDHVHQPRPHLDSLSRRDDGVDYSSRYVLPPDIWATSLDTASHLTSEYQTRWQQLIGQRHLTDSQVIELKQALASVVAENDILLAKLSNARQEVHDKLTHTNGVLEDCRQHLAKAQVDNMEYRSQLEQERAVSSRLEARVQELEKALAEIKCYKQQLEKELDDTVSQMDQSMAETGPDMDSLLDENSHLISRLAHVENENDFLKEDFQKLKQSHTKAMNTIEDLRDCLEKIRKERQDLFDEVTSLQRREQTARVREIISSYQEKGALDESERERQRQEQTDSDEGIFSESQASSTASLSARHSARSARRSSNQSPHERSSSPTARKRSSSQQRYNTHDDLSPTRSREIYPHRRSYSPQNRSVSPAQVQRSSRPYVDEYFINKTLEEIEDDIQQEKQKLFENLAVQPKKIRFSSEHSRNEHSTADQYFRAISEHKRRQSPDRLNQQLKKSQPSTQARRSDHSKDDHHRRRHQSPSPGQRSPRPSILKSSDTFNQSSTVPSRSPSPALRKNRSINTDRESHTSPASCPSDSVNSRSRRTKDGAGDFARCLQGESEDKLLQTLSNSPILKNKSWYEIQSDSDDCDTEHYSSLDSQSCCDNVRFWNKAPLLTDEQRRYADQLVQKYTGALPS
ncbi:uncharacterized protein LOC131954204 isoform X2 [Physella acuta]|uniref:uncharacterized protein LOC131954204 isoform X2 n=1 Tax=Physella acuta TaxID=109671 RepID=UPI0027DEA6A7|nr:uncharacterized protein LOC131954204 isoform X2 [Physella acuta]